MKKTTLVLGTLGVLTAGYITLLLQLRDHLEVGAPGADARAVVVTAEGEIVVVGTNLPPDSGVASNLWVGRLTAAGEPVWHRTHDAEDGVITGVDVELDETGGLHIAGTLTGTPPSAGLISLGGSGEVRATHPCPTPEQGFAFGLQSLDADTRVLLGSSERGSLICAVGPDGVRWSKRLELGWAADLVARTGELVVMTTFDMREGRGARYRPRILRLDLEGQVLDQSLPWNEGAAGQLLPLDDGVLLVGTSNKQGRLSALDGRGEIRWDRLLGEAGSGFAAAVPTAEGWILAGFTGHEDHAADGWVVSVDVTGELLWETRLPGGAGASLRDVALLPDGSVIAVGQAPGEEWPLAWLVHLDPGGALLWERRLGPRDLPAQTG